MERLGVHAEDGNNDGEAANEIHGLAPDSNLAFKILTLSLAVSVTLMIKNIFRHSLGSKRSLHISHD